MAAGVLLSALMLSSTSKMEITARQKENAVRRAVEKEVRQSPGHPWAGEFYEGDGLGTNISLFLGPQSGFMYRWHGCLGLYGHNYGTVSETDGEVVLHCAMKNVEGEFGNIYTRYIPVRWDKREYLVPAARMVDFCNDVNSSREPRAFAHGRFLLKADDWDLPVTGAPEVSPEFKDYLIDLPIRARIVEVQSIRERNDVEGRGYTETIVLIDAGAASGLLVDMELSVNEPDTFMPFKVISVDDKSAKCRSTHPVFPQHRPAVGWLLSTKANETP